MMIFFDTFRFFDFAFTILSNQFSNVFLGVRSASYSKPSNPIFRGH